MNPPEPQRNSIIRALMPIGWLFISVGLLGTLYSLAATQSDLDAANKAQAGDPTNQKNRKLRATGENYQFRVDTTPYDSRRRTAYEENAPYLRMGIISFVIGVVFLVVGFVTRRRRPARVENAFPGSRT